LTVRRSTTPSDNGDNLSGDNDKMDALDIIPMAMDIDSSGESDDDAKRESLTSEYQDVGQEVRDGFFDLTDDED